MHDFANNPISYVNLVYDVYKTFPIIFGECGKLIYLISRKPSRCHFVMVSGFTMTSVFVHLGQAPRSVTQNRRSMS